MKTAANIVLEVYCQGATEQKLVNIIAERDAEWQALVDAEKAAHVASLDEAIRDMTAVRDAITKDIEQARREGWEAGVRSLQSAAWRSCDFDLEVQADDLIAKGPPIITVRPASTLTITGRVLTGLPPSSGSRGVTLDSTGGNHVLTYKAEKGES